MTHPELDAFCALAVGILMGSLLTLLALGSMYGELP